MYIISFIKIIHLLFLIRDGKNGAYMVSEFIRYTVNWLGDETLKYYLRRYLFILFLYGFLHDTNTQKYNNNNLCDVLGIDIYCILNNSYNNLFLIQKYHFLSE